MKIPFPERRLRGKWKGVSKESNDETVNRVSYLALLKFILTNLVGPIQKLIAKLIEILFGSSSECNHHLSIGITHPNAGFVAEKFSIKRKPSDLVPFHMKFKEVYNFDCMFRDDADEETDSNLSMYQTALINSMRKKANNQSFIVPVFQLHRYKNISYALQINVRFGSSALDKPFIKLQRANLQASPIVYSYLMMGLLSVLYYSVMS